VQPKSVPALAFGYFTVRLRTLDQPEAWRIAQGHGRMLRNANRVSMRCSGLLVAPSLSEEPVVCNHELLASSPPLAETIAVPKSPSPRSNGHSASRSVNGSANGSTNESTSRSNGRRVDDDQVGTRPGDQDMRLARLPTEPVRAEPSARDIQQTLRRDDCAGAVARDRERIAEGLYDTVIHRLFAAGLQLQATCQVVEGPARDRIESTIDLLDTTISELRKAIFSLR
jgi:signal transduction histidine kinase